MPQITNSYYQTYIVPPCVEDAVIGICGFYPGQSMTYLFDFGDQILFDITLLKIDATEPLPHSPLVVEQKGDLPEPDLDWDYMFR